MKTDSRLHLILFLLVLALCGGTVASAADFYVDPVSGNNSNNGTSTATACLTLKMSPCAGETGEVVFVLGELHLQHAFFCVSMLREDIENERSSVYHTDVSECLFQFALVAR